MKEFEFHRPRSVAEAASLMAAVPDARPLAGGMTLIPSMKLRLSEPPALIDLRGVSGMRGVQSGQGGLSIGAMTPHAEVAASPLVSAAIPALAALAGGIGDPQVRNRGTIGGSLAPAIHRPTTRRPCSRSKPAWSRTAGRFPRATISAACSRPRWRPGN